MACASEAVSTGCTWLILQPINLPAASLPAAPELQDLPQVLPDHWRARVAAKLRFILAAASALHLPAAIFSTQNFLGAKGKSCPVPGPRALCVYSHQKSCRSCDQTQHNNFSVTQEPHTGAWWHCHPIHRTALHTQSVWCTTQSLINTQKPPTEKGELQVHRISLLIQPYFPMVLPAPINNFLQ